MVKIIKIKKKDKGYENIISAFWKEYKESDYFERKKRISFITKRIVELDVIKDKRMRKSIITQSLMSYFDDLIELKGGKI